MISPDVYIVTTRELEKIKLDEYRRGRKAAFAEAADTNPRCHGGRDGDCFWELCPQNKDDEPRKSGRHCPLDKDTDEHE